MSFGDFYEKGAVHIDHSKAIFGSIHGKTVTIIDGKMVIDGKPLEEFAAAMNDKEVKEIHITIEGDVERLEVSVCNEVVVNGNAKRVKANTGSIKIAGNVEGDVHANMGSITCGNVEGDCHANMGSIYRRGGEE